MRELIEYLNNHSEIFAYSWVENKHVELVAVIQELKDFASFLGKVEKRNIQFSLWIK